MVSVIVTENNRNILTITKKEIFRNVYEGTFVFGPGCCPFCEFANISKELTYVEGTNSRYFDIVRQRKALLIDSVLQIHIFVRII